MNKKISLGTAIALILITIAVTFSMTMVYSSGVFSDKMHAIKDREALYSKLSEIDNLVRTNALADIDNEKLMDSIAKGYISGMNDQYAAYMTAADYKAKLESNEGQVGEIGIDVSQDESGYMFIEDVLEGSPAEEAGLYPGDLIIKIGETDVKSENFEECEAMLKDDPGTILSLVIRRDAEDKTMEITRRIIEIPTVIANQFDNYGYIKILTFDSTTPNQFNKALDQLMDNHIEGIIFDVRNNSGGTINSVCSILDRLLPEGPIVSATYKNGTTELLKSSDMFEIDLPMVVITNKNSASAAELFTQALKDYNKAKSVGNTTFGKGLMQTVYQLTDGSALEITVAKYSPPLSENFDGVGVKPDYEISLDPELEKILEYISPNDDAQLKKAIDVLASSIRKESTDDFYDENDYSEEESMEDESQSAYEDEESDYSGDESSDNSEEEEETESSDESSDDSSSESPNESSDEDDESSQEESEEGEE